MKRIALLVAGLLLVSTAATAGPNWQTLSISISLTDVPKVVAALDKLISTSGDDLTGTVSLMANIVGGNSPASHTFISSFDSRAEREAWIQNLLPSAAWAEYGKATEGLVERHATSRMDFMKSWGDESDKDVLWEIYAFKVIDAAVFASAIDRLLTSDTGKKFPGQVHLSAVAFAGDWPATHLISVGFESEAEAESWGDLLTPTEDWASYQMVSNKVSTFVGSYLIRTIKTWGNTGE